MTEKEIISCLKTTLFTNSFGMYEAGNIIQPQRMQSLLLKYPNYLLITDMLEEMVSEGYVDKKDGVYTLSVYGASVLNLP